MEEKNRLVYMTSKTYDRKNITVTIRLDDQCNNGHQDFSITADIYEADKPKTDKYFIGGGCCHDEILKAFPEFKIFVNLHLCDYTGTPMHARANGFYHLKEGFNNTKPGNPKFAAEFCEYYRLTLKQFEALKETETEIQFAILLQKLGVLEQWQHEANKAIKILEGFTGHQFMVDSKRTQWIAPTPREIAEENKKQASGYYTDKAKKAREEAAVKKQFTDLKKEFEKELKEKTDSIKLEYEVKNAVLTAGGSKALDNCIFYTHSKELAFNWRSYDNLPKETIEVIKKKIRLPKGVTIKNEEK